MSDAVRAATVRAILYAFLANRGIAIARSRAARPAGSGSMLAAAIHRFADAGPALVLHRTGRRGPGESPALPAALSRP